MLGVCCVRGINTITIKNTKWITILQTLKETHEVPTLIVCRHTCNIGFFISAIKQQLFMVTSLSMNVSKFSEVSSTKFLGQ